MLINAVPSRYTEAERNEKPSASQRTSYFSQIIPAMDAAVGFISQGSLKTENRCITRSDDDILQHGPLEMDHLDRAEKKGP